MKPVLTSLSDVITKADAIIDYATKNPFDEVIYKFEATESTVDLIACSGVIAGSKAVTLLHQALKNTESLVQENKSLFNNKEVKQYLASLNPVSMDRVQVSDLIRRIDVFNMKQVPRRVQWGDFTSNDVDLFMLGQKKSYRVDCHPLDIVYVTHETIDCLLLFGFDLPCCRAARDLENKFYVSLQCLYSMLTGKVHVPLYLADENLYKTLVSDTKKVCIEKIQLRIEKYKQRGCTFVFKESKLLPCHLKQFTY